MGDVAIAWAIPVACETTTELTGLSRIPCTISTISCTF